ncbi:MAG: T9SS type A sorting domain-containing protein [Bacteroidetes bacterium]|nr:MAG: T9SS type A sorting domain-containing protein [Bacteroidota bacterium]
MMYKRLPAFLALTLLSLNGFSQCPIGEVEVSIDVATDTYARECYWELVPAVNSCGAGTIFSGGNSAVGCNGGSLQNNPSGGYPNNSIIQEGPWCLSQGANYKIIFVDDYGDGGLTFTVKINGFPVYTGLTGSGANAGTPLIFTAEPPPAFDMSCRGIQLASYVNIGNVPVIAEFFNRGSVTISSMDVHYSIDNGTAISSSVSGLSLAPFTGSNITNSIAWPAMSNGVYTIKVWASNLNGNADLNNNNDTAYRTLTVGPGIPNIIDDYIGVTPILTVIGNSADGVSVPRDLDFHPVLTRNELWVINKSTENSGGETVKFSNAGQAGQTSLLQQDGNAWHFMSLPTGIAFSDNENFATSPGVYDANHNGGAPFTGPSLWSSNAAIYAQPSGGNGSHLDMLHQTPYGMGICHEADNIFWVFDQDGGDPVRYDFKEDHGPGNDDHSDAVIRRYEGLGLQGEPTYHVPSHLVLDKESGMLYIVDTNNDRILKMDIHSGSFAANLTQYEAVAEYSSYTGASWSVFANTGLVTPSGIDIIEDRLIVSDYASGDIIIYSTAGSTGVELGRIVTGTPGIMGIKIGPDGKIWYVNATTNIVGRIDGLSVGIKSNSNVSALDVFPNPAGNIATLRLDAPLSEPAQVSVINMTGQLVLTSVMHRGESTLQLNTENLTAGIYAIRLLDGVEISNTRFVKK